MAIQDHDDPIGGIPIVPAGENPPSVPSEAAGDVPSPRSRNKEKKRRKAPSSRIGRFLLAIAGILFCLLLCVYLLVPYLLTNGIPHYLGDRLHRSITVGDADFSLLPPKLTLRHCIIGPRTDVSGDRVDPLFSFSELSVTLKQQALLEGKLSFQALSVEHPFFHLVIHQDGSSNLSALLTEVNGTQQVQPIGRLLSRLLQFDSAADIRINDGQLLIDDQNSGKHHSIQKIMVWLPAGTVAARRRGQHIATEGRPPEISAVLNGRPVTLAVRETATPEGKSLDLQLQINDADLLPYASYIPATFGYRLLAGRGDLRLDCLLPRHRGAAGSIQFSATLRLSGLRLEDMASTKISVGSLGLSARYLTASRQLVIKDLSIDEPSFSVTRQADGTWSFPGKKLLSQLGQQNSPDSPWRLEELSLHHGTALLTDLAIKGGFTETFEGIALALHGRPAAEPNAATSFSLQARSRQGTTVTMEGKLFFSSSSGSGMLLVDNLPLPGISPYLTAMLGQVILKDGNLDKGSATFSFSEKKKGPLAIDLSKANLQVNGLSLISQQGGYLLPIVKINDAVLDTAARRIEVGQLNVPDLKASLPENDLLALARPLPPSTSPENEANQVGWQVAVHQADLQRATIQISGNDHASRLFSFHKTRMVNLANTAGTAGKDCRQPLFFCRRHPAVYRQALSSTFSKRIADYSGRSPLAAVSGILGQLAESVSPDGNSPGKWNRAAARTLLYRQFWRQ